MLEFFHKEGVAYPELCFLVSSAVGFPVSIYWLGKGPGKKGTRRSDTATGPAPGPPPP